MGTLRALLAALILASLGCGAELKITLLATTDLHGNLFPYDYFTAQPAARGLAKIATLIQAARAENPNNLLIDCGDTIQGTRARSRVSGVRARRPFTLEAFVRGRTSGTRSDDAGDERDRL